MIFPSNRKLPNFRFLTNRKHKKIDFRLIGNIKIFDFRLIGNLGKNIIFPIRPKSRCTLLFKKVFSVESLKRGNRNRPRRKSNSSKSHNGRNRGRNREGGSRKSDRNPSGSNNKNQNANLETTPNNRQITSGCVLNREGRIVCKVDNTEEWRRNLNEAIERRNDLRKQSNTVDRVIKKLRESKKIQPGYFKPGYIPCKCNPETTYKKTLEEERLKYRDGKTSEIHFSKFDLF